MRSSSILWALVLHRKAYPLLFSPIGKGIARAGSREVLHVYEDTFVRIYLEKESNRTLQRMKRNIIKEINQNPEFPREYLAKLLNHSRSLNRLLLSLYEKDLSGLSNRKLFSDFSKIYRKLILDGASIFPAYFVRQRNLEPAEKLFGSDAKYQPYNLAISLIFDSMMKKILSRKVRNRERVNEYLSILHSSPYLSPIAEEEREMLKLVMDFRRGHEREIDKKLREHLKKYAWIPTDFGFGKPWNTGDVKKRFGKFLRLSLSELEERLKKIESYTSEIRERKEELIRSLNLPKDVQKIIELVEVTGFIRLYRRYNWAQVFYYAAPLLEEMRKRLKLSMSDLLFCTYEEIRNALLHQRKIDQSTIAPRKKRYAIHFTPERIAYYAGSSVEEFLASQQFYEPEEKTERKTIEGTVACRGKVRGIAKIVLNLSDMKKVREGEILVAHETTPDFLPVMERASAFVTDEGGLSCHAAIVAREMGKPCVVGTKIATRVLRDGDFIEVDAVNGVIKIIKRKERERA